MNDLSRNLVAGVRLALYFPLERADFRISVNQVYALYLLGVASAIGIEYAATPSPVAFNGNGLPIYAAGLLAFLLACYLVAAAYRATDRFAELIIPLLSTGPLIYVAIGGLRLISMDHPEYLTGTLNWIGWVYLAWFAVVAERVMRILYGSGLLRRFVVVAAYTACILAPHFLFYPIPTWYTGAAATASASPRLDVETTYYRQSALMGRALEALKAQRSGVIDLYSVGFAGYGHQDVFMKEVRAVQEILGRRFDARGRSVALINNEATVETTPLANLHNLRTALKGIASKMDVAEDVLFLFLTSHGSKNHYLSTDLGRLAHNAISGPEIRRSLDEAGIRWRVVVVSACYSGGFIDALAGDRTLVITAARRDRTSFGCGVGRDWTYFGEAFFADALSAGRRSFIHAFETAVAFVAAREADESLEPSEPQISIGTAIAEKLRRLEDRLIRDAGFDMSLSVAP